MGRNTAPALTLAALPAREGGADPVLVVSPADQTVTDRAAFTAALRRAVRGAADGAIVHLRHHARPPGDRLRLHPQHAPATALHKVAQFVEKPDAATAERYLAEGGYYLEQRHVRAARLGLAEGAGAFRPDILAATAGRLERPHARRRASSARRARPSLAVPSESVDYAVMERCPGSAFDIRMVPLDAGWNDLGAWDAVWQVAAQGRRRQLPPSAT